MSVLTDRTYHDGNLTLTTTMCVTSCCVVQYKFILYIYIYIYIYNYFCTSFVIELY